MLRAIRMTGTQHEFLRRHLFPGDGNEAVALMLCGRLAEGDQHILCAYEIYPISHESCRERTPDRVTWNPEHGRGLFDKAVAKSMAILKVHSHPGGYDMFSEFDDKSDSDLFSSLHAWTDDGFPHASAVMLPTGRLFARFVERDRSFHDVEKILVVGDEIRLFRTETTEAVDGAQLRTSQTFGEKTTRLLKKLRVGVVGCSGTGSWVIEQLSRLGVGQLLLVDPDTVEKKNLNRIVNTTEDDARDKKGKVYALRDTILTHGTQNGVEVLQASLLEEAVAKKLAGCDVLFGCMDSVEGRDRLNRLAAFYTLPYFDLGVRLDADGSGGISNVSGVVHYLIPGGSSLLSRGAYSSEALRVEALRRTDPEQYRRELDDGYIKGAKVDSPAVISVNGFCATMAVNELLARIHPYRSGKLAEERRQQFDLKNCFWHQLEDGPSCSMLAKFAGRGDMLPFLNSMS